MKISIKISTNRWFSRRYTRILPESWDDIPLKIRVKYAQILWQNPSISAFIPILKDILKLSKSAFLGISKEDTAVLIQNLAFMRDDLGIKSLVPYFKHEGIEYHFIKPDFDNGTAREYALADEYYTAFAQNQEDTDALLLLTSALVRTNPSVPNYSRDRVENRLESFKNLPIQYIIMALQYFEALKKEVYEVGMTVDLFKAPESSNENTDDIIEFGWWTSYRYIAKSQAFGTFNQVCDSLFWDIFKYLIEEKQRENLTPKAINSQQPITTNQ